MSPSGPRLPPVDVDFSLGSDVDFCVLRTFHRISLTEQMRAADDAYHCALLQRFHLDDTTPPITPEALSSFQRLPPQLLITDPKFHDDLVAVQSDQERRTFNTLPLSHFAPRDSIPIFSWYSPVKNNNGVPSSPYAEEINEQKGLKKLSCSCSSRAYLFFSLLGKATVPGLSATVDARKLTLSRMTIRILPSRCLRKP